MRRIRCNWSQDLSSALPNSFLLVSQQFGHTSFYTSPCVAEHAGQFLVSATLPQPARSARRPDVDAVASEPERQ